MPGPHVEWLLVGGPENGRVLMGIHPGAIEFECCTGGMHNLKRFTYHAHDFVVHRRIYRLGMPSFMYTDFKIPPDAELVALIHRSGVQFHSYKE